MNNETVEATDEPKATPDQVFALAGRFVTEVNSWGLPRHVVLAAKEKTDHPLWDAIRDVLVPKPKQPIVEELTAPEKPLGRPKVQVLLKRPKPCAKRSVDEQVVGLKDMYIELGWTWSESGLVIPDRRTGFDRLIVFADVSLTNNRVFGVCKASFPSWRFVNDLDSAVLAKTDQRHSCCGPYAIWVRDEVDSDIGLKDMSATNIAGDGDLNTVTLLERMLLELIHFRETGEHLDTRTWTLCAGSRYSSGIVPCTHWYDGRFGVGWNFPDRGNPLLRARQAVTL